MHVVHADNPSAQRRAVAAAAAAERAEWSNDDPLEAQESHVAETFSSVLDRSDLQAEESIAVGQVVVAPIQEPELRYLPVNSFVSVGEDKDSQGERIQRPVKGSADGPSEETVRQSVRHHHQTPAEAPEAVRDKCGHPLHGWKCVKKVSEDSGGATELKTAVGSEIKESVGVVKELAKSSTEGIQKTSSAPVAVTSGEEQQRAKNSGWAGADPCTHAFHSWLCNKPTRTSARTVAPVPATQASVIETTTPPTTPAPPTAAQTLTPQFIREEPVVPEASNFDGNLLVPVADTTSTTTSTTTTTTPAPTPTTMTKSSGWAGADPCTHAFHSWLCVKPATRKAKTTTTTPAPPPAPPSTAASIVVTEIPAASNIEDTQITPQATQAPVPVTTTTTTTTPAPPPPTTTTQAPPPPPPPSTTTPTPSTPMKKVWDDKDSCSHAFHSWLCVPKSSKARTSNPSTRAPTTKAPTTKAPVTPVVSVEVPLVPAPSNSDESSLLEPVKVVAKTAAPPVAPSAWAGADPCTHAFHRWLCNRSGDNRLRISRQSIPSAASHSSPNSQEVAEELALVTRWQRFESKRVRASAASGLLSNWTTFNPPTPERLFDTAYKGRRN